MKSQTKNYVALLTMTTLIVILACTQLTFAYFGTIKTFDTYSGGVTAAAFVREANPVKGVGSNPTPSTIEPSSYPAYATAIALREGVEPALFHAVIYQESRWNPKARSKKGAYGLTQLMPGTAKELGVNRYDPIQNMIGGARYLRQQLDAHDGDVQKALWAYNGGAGNVKRGVIRRESRLYANNIMNSL